MTREVLHVPWAQLAVPARWYQELRLREGQGGLKEAAIILGLRLKYSANFSLAEKARRKGVQEGLGQVRVSACLLDVSESRSKPRLLFPVTTQGKRLPRSSVSLLRMQRVPGTGYPMLAG